MPNNSKWSDILVVFINKRLIMSFLLCILSTLSCRRMQHHVMLVVDFMHYTCYPDIYEIIRDIAMTHLFE